MDVLGFAGFFNEEMLKMKYFRILSYLEGASLVALLLVAMPLKYLAGNPEPVRFIGTIHGALFLMFVYTSIMLGRQLRWPLRRIVIAWMIASIPFGPVFFEKVLFEKAA
jgi:integral membrane protein